MIIPDTVSASLAAPLFNHLWQSTVVLAFAWILTILFRRNPARVRYVIWMLASLKFLVPFALLTAVGERWAMPVAGRSVASAFYTAADQIGQPFQNTFNSAASSAQTRSAANPWPDAWLSLLPSVLAALWASGFILMGAAWLARWARMAQIARRSPAPDPGREFEALRSAEFQAGLRRPILLLASSHAIEPGVFGIIRPVLLWPSAILPNSTMRRSPPSWRTKSDMSAAATTSPPRSTCSFRLCSGSIPPCIGWPLASWKNASAPAMKRFSNPAAAPTPTPKASSRCVRSVLNRLRPASPASPVPISSSAFFAS